MAFSIKNDEADCLARQLAHLTGESLTEAVLISLRERLQREERRRRDPDEMIRKIQAIVEEVRKLPVLDDRPADEILYDEWGLPH